MIFGPLLSPTPVEIFWFQSFLEKCSRESLSMVEERSLTSKTSANVYTLEFCTNPHPPPPLPQNSGLLSRGILTKVETWRPSLCWGWQSHGWSAPWFPPRAQRLTKNSEMKRHGFWCCRTWKRAVSVTPLTQLWVRQNRKCSLGTPVGDWISSSGGGGSGWQGCPWALPSNSPPILG